MLFFNNNKQDKIFLNYLPKGKIYKQASINGTNFNKLIQWIGASFEWLVDAYNVVFNGLFILRGTYFIKKFKKDYSIPNEIFYQTTDQEHQIDIIVLKYLMKSNRSWNFKAIANAYGICVDVWAGAKYYRPSRLPNSVPHYLMSDFTNINNIIVVKFYFDEYDVLPHNVPHKLGTGIKIAKIKKIYDIIKPAQTKIVYVSGASKDCEKIKIEAGVI